MSRFPWVKATVLVSTACPVLVMACSSSDDATGPGTPPQILSVTPAANANSAGASTDLVVEFDQPLDPATLSPDDIRVFGRWSGVLAGSVILANGDRELRFSPSRPLSAGEWVTATIPAGAVRTTRSVELEQGYTWTFWVASTPTSMTLDHVSTLDVRRPGDGHVQTYGAYAGDLDGDGWSDLILPNEESDDLRVFMNDGRGGYGPFAVVPIPEADDPSTNEGADFDGDGDIDFAVGSAQESYVAIFHGDGTGGLVHRQNLEAGAEVHGVCLLDLENDGDPDLAAAAHEANHVAVFENDGSGLFTSLGTFEAGDGEWSCATGDLDEDGLVDLVIGSRDGLEIAAFVSNGDGTFSETDRIGAGGDPWMLASGDLDGDGHVDFAAVNAAEGALATYGGDSEGGLTPNQTQFLGGFPLALDLGDLDGDGDLDAVSSHFGSGRFWVHENVEGVLVPRPDILLTAPTAASCAILHDRDNDGDLDVSGIDEISDLLILFENR